MSSVLSQRLRQCRKERRLSQREVGIFCDITEKAYQNYELGTREPKVSILMRIAEFYKVSVDYLVGLTDVSEPYPRKQGG